MQLLTIDCIDNASLHKVMSIDLFGLNDSQNMYTDLHFIEQADTYSHTHIFFPFSSYLQVPIGRFQIKFCTILSNTSHSRKFRQNFIMITVRHVLIFHLRMETKLNANLSKFCHLFAVQKMNACFLIRFTVDFAVLRCSDTYR